jgi:hypothetical protein
LPLPLPLPNFELVAIQEVRWDKGGNEPADDYTFIFGKRNANHHLGTSFFVYKEIISIVKMVEFFNDSMSYITIRDC